MKLRPLAMLIAASLGACIVSVDPKEPRPCSDAGACLPGFACVQGMCLASAADAAAPDAALPDSGDELDASVADAADAGSPGEDAAVPGLDAASLDAACSSGVTVTTLAGQAGVPGLANGPGDAALLNSPRGMAVDDAGNVYLADEENAAIRKIAPDGTTSTLADKTHCGVDGGCGLSLPVGIALDLLGNAYVGDIDNCILKITPDGTTTPLAGLCGPAGYGSQDGTGIEARFSNPRGVALDPSGKLWVAEETHTIRKVDILTGETATIAGTWGTAGCANGPVASSTFAKPEGVAVDSAGNVFVADTDNHCIRKIDVGQMTTSTFAGPCVSQWCPATDDAGIAANFNAPAAVAVDGAGNVYVADSGNHRIRRIDPSGNICTIAGPDDATAGYNEASGDGSLARFHLPAGIAVQGPLLLVGDSLNHVVRVIHR